MDNSKIAEIFEEIADMLELDPKSNRFEPLAYRKAALTIGTLQQDVREIYEKEGIDGLLKLQGVGKTIAERLAEYFKTGKIKKYDELKRKFPIDFAGLTKIQGMGAKKALKLYQLLGVKNIDDLKKAIGQHRIRNLEGFGERSEEELSKGIALLEESKGRMLLGAALPEAEILIRKLKESGLVERAELCGSTRRMRETVGDLDILLISKKADAVMDFVTKMQETEHVIVKGPTKTTVWLKIGLSCDFRVIEPESFGAAMQYFIGSKNHNIKLREIAIKKGYKLNEYGLFNKSNNNVVAGEDESEIYKK
ncbi:MAG: helix-hairpin-helix domain-containing protein, partial [Candidatus Micrarchaeaceae archaeon]